MDNGIYTRSSSDGVNWSVWKGPDGATSDTISTIQFQDRLHQTVRGLDDGIYTRTSGDGNLWTTWSGPDGRTGNDNQRPFKNFSGEEFKNFYNNFRYDKVNQINYKPSIRGNVAADSRIQTLAENRGYQLRSEATCQCLQTEANNAFQAMRNEAAKNGLNLQLVSGFRSINEQRNIFNSNLGSVSNQQIASGQADYLINSILKTISIPGYSRHHTGYTIDLGCGDNNLLRFRNTPCYAWLSANNYYNAKRFGFIPSYPDGASLQGPDPEPWEYVWVGESDLREKSGSYKIEQVVFNGKLIQAVRGTGDNIYTRYTSNGVNWIGWGSPSGQTLEAVSQVVYKGRLVQTVRGMNNGIYTRVSTDGLNWSDWGIPNGATIGQVSLVVL
jgi:D-alanyl-D-alanine carboxypeptidase